ncbi:MAG: hypothetical protein ABI233_02405 [Chthoniobacterales bacterium]
MSHLPFSIRDLLSISVRSRSHFGLHAPQPAFRLLAVSSCRIVAGIAAGSKEPNKTKVGKVTRKQIMDIVKTKANDLNSRSDEADFEIIAGTAGQMGLEVVE